MDKHNTSQSPGQKKSFNYGYIIVLASFVIIMINVGMLLTIGVFFKPIAEDMGWTRAETSLPIAVSTVVTAIFAIITGNLADKYGPRRVTLGIVILTGAGYLLMSGLSSLWEFYLYFGLLIGLGPSLMGPLLSLIPRWFVKNRTIMAGIVSAGGGVGGLIMPLVADWLIKSSNWHQAYLIQGIIYLVLGLTAVWFLKHKPLNLPEEAVTAQGAKNSVRPAPSSESSLKPVFKSGNFWMMILMFFSFGFVANIVNIHVAPNATDVGVDSTAAAGLLSLMNGISIIGCIALGAMGDKIGNRKMLIFTYLFNCGVMIALVFVKSLWLMNVLMVVYGLAFGSGLAQNSPLVARLFGTRSLGLILGIILFAQTIGSGLGSVLPGYFFDLNQSYFWGFISGGILCLLALIATLSLRMKPSNTANS
jgi:MFS family permease